MARSLSFLSEVIVYDPPFEAVLSTEEECEVFLVRSIRLRVLSDRSPRTPVFKIVSPPFSLFFPLSLLVSHFAKVFTGRFLGTDTVTSFAVSCDSSTEIAIR